MTNPHDSEEREAGAGAGNTAQPASSATEQLAAMLQGHSVISEGLDEYAEADITLESEEETKGINWPVVGAAGAVALAIVIWGLVGSDSFATFAQTALDFVVTNFGWAFVLFGTVFVAFVAVIALSKFGTIKLGRIDEEPEFSSVSWIAMMFAAGMGIGLMFYGASEPLTFFRQGVPGHPAEDVNSAMASAMFHWTLHPWAIYAIVGLAIAYSTFRIGRRQLISSAFTPLIGEKRAKGWLGQLIDTLAIFATVFGTACSLGVGAIQIGAGLSAAGIVESPGTWVIIGIVSVLTLAFLLSAISGVGKGIQYLSNANMILAAILAIVVFVLGPTVAVLNLIPGSVGGYLSEFFSMASRTATNSDGEWLSSWTIFYWAWWISWSPFVGMFLARISRGRSIREFCVGVLLIPAGVSTVWFAIFGGTAITMEREGKSVWGDGSAENQLFNLLHNLPGGEIMGIVAVILLGTFFITSADSASTVMGSMSQYGRTDANPFVSASWGLLTALIGLTLLVSGGDDVLTNLQNVTIVAAAPFLVIVIALMFALVKDLRNDVIYLDYREQQRFARSLARERRIHREYVQREQLRARRLARRTKRQERAGSGRAGADKLG
ncbi:MULTISPECIES: BCCT family transporter [unclassified Corynebacterium]|uniref:BCCT family transporter n=1 Tax=unclassified Corynebacterium TaxID=2624378 RepID=UPI0029CA4CCB|nr:MULTISPECIES: BCCT family transporter [unclassified Corynebacterium]WPF66796.1 BCCT family transporter [Corynebacterium sp. 22KM0430]WPF69284.1 BCCT family transporter [Corynebacterium sp. 21KM1197]